MLQKNIKKKQEYLHFDQNLNDQLHGRAEGESETQDRWAKIIIHKMETTILIQKMEAYCDKSWE